MSHKWGWGLLLVFLAAAGVTFYLFYELPETAHPAADITDLSGLYSAEKEIAAARQELATAEPAQVITADSSGSRQIALVLDGLPAHKGRGVRDYVDSLKGKLTLHFLPGYAPDLNPDELVWSYAKRTGVARSPLRGGEKLADRVHAQLSDIASRPDLVRSFFRHPSVAYISDL